MLEAHALDGAAPVRLAASHRRPAGVAASQFRRMHSFTIHQHAATAADCKGT